MERLTLNLPLLLPHVEDTDQCVTLLTERLAAVRGVEHAHIARSNGAAELCLHYDPNLVSLDRIRRLAEEAGAEMSTRYRHETIPVFGMDAADAADSLTGVLQELEGVLHAQVSYAANLAFVAYDAEVASRGQIEQALRRMGYSLATPGFATLPTQREEHAGHDHGSAPAFLPHWMQERWTLILVALAGGFLLIGWSGERFFGLPEQVALLFYILSYLAGGYDIATHAIPSLLRGKFDTDVLMLAAAAGAAVLGEWTEGAFLLFL